MTIQPIDNHSVALYLTGEELRQYGVSPATLTLEEARAMTREACGQAGIALSGGVEIEAYPEKNGVMLFVYGRETPPPRPIPRRPMRKQRERRHYK